MVVKRGLSRETAVLHESTVTVTVRRSPADYVQHRLHARMNGAGLRDSRGFGLHRIK